MGFDESDGQPLIHPRRWGTKVNFAIGLGVLAMCWMRAHKDKVANDVPPKIESKR